MTNLAYKINDSAEKFTLIESKPNLIKQKCIGVLLLILAVLLLVIMDGDGTVSLLLIPMGIMAIKEKRNIFN